MLLSVSDICTGRRHTATVTHETKCYYTIKIVGYYSNGNSLVERIHKNTMYIDYMHLSFSIIKKLSVDEMIKEMDNPTGISGYKRARADLAAMAVTYSETIDLSYEEAIQFYINELEYSIGADKALFNGFKAYNRLISWFSIKELTEIAREC